MDDSRQATHGGGDGGACAADAATLFEPVLAALAKADESERFRLVASLLDEIAERTRSGALGSRCTDQIEALTKKIQALGEERATLNDTLAASRAELAHREKQLEAERARAEEVQRIVDDQRTRAKAAQAEQSEREAELVARNAEVHRLRVENEELTLKLQRARRDASGQDRIDALEKANRELRVQLAEHPAGMDQLRTDKDAEIERLKAELRQSQSSASESADALLAKLWDRLASAKPPLAEGHVQPGVQAAERLTDAFIELVHFADDFDKAMRVFLGKYTRHQPAVKVPWDVYAKRDDVYKTARQTVAPQRGKPVGLLKMRLRFLYSWSQAAMVGCDSAIESMASELQSFLMGPAGAGADPNRKIKEFLRDDGHELFLEHIRELRSTKLAESYGRGG